MGIYIPGMTMPPRGKVKMLVLFDDGVLLDNEDGQNQWRAIELPPHGRLIDADALRRTMYHEAFETDTPMQRWDSGCWIRFKLFERMEEAAPTIIPADPDGGADG